MAMNVKISSSINLAVMFKPYSPNFSPANAWSVNPKISWQNAAVLLKISGENVAVAVYLVTIALAIICKKIEFVRLTKYLYVFPKNYVKSITLLW